MKYIFSIFMAFFVLSSCSEDSISPVEQELKLFNISNTDAFQGDTIYIYGSGLGQRADSTYIEIIKDTLDTMRISSHDTYFWSSAKIGLILADSLISGDLYAIVDKDTSNSLKFDFNLFRNIEEIEITAGTFMMGSDNGLDPESPAHSITLTRDFYISKFEVTEAEWKRIMGEYHNAEVQAGNYPVEGLSWKEAVEFCNAASEFYSYELVYTIEEDTVIMNIDANGFRLPLEAEWEYALKAGTDNNDYPGGEIDEVAWYLDNSGYQAHLVAQKKANPWGIFDMQGNVREWCWDYFSEDYYELSPDTDPMGAESSDTRVMRGGSWKDGASLIRATNRVFYNSQEYTAGIRLVRTKTEE